MSHSDTGPTPAPSASTKATSNTTAPSTTNSAHKIFTICELVEEILTNLEYKDVALNCRKVNRIFHACASSYYTVQRLPDIYATFNGRQYMRPLFKSVYEIANTGFVNYVPVDGLPKFTFQTSPSNGLHSIPPATQFFHVTIESQKDAVALRRRSTTESWRAWDLVAETDISELSVTLRHVPNGKPVLANAGPGGVDYTRGIDGKKGDTKWLTLKVDCLGTRLGPALTCAADVVLNCEQAWTGVETAEEDTGMEATREGILDLDMAMMERFRKREREEEELVGRMSVEERERWLTEKEERMWREAGRAGSILRRPGPQSATM